MLFTRWLLAIPAAAAASGSHHNRMQNLVTFGDSLLDEGRLAYFENHDGNAPPPGMMLPPSNQTASGGYAWGRLAADKTGARYYNYAVSGARCSNEIVSRYWWVIGKDLPSVLEYEVPAFKADIVFENLYPDRRADNTVYALWIGTNDLGYPSFIVDSQAPGATISTFVDCIWDVFDGVYETGGRNFVLVNQMPLEMSPMYAPPSTGGQGDTIYWSNYTDYNMTSYQYKILEYTTSVNTMFDYGAAFHVLVKQRWPGAKLTVFDAHGLLNDVRDDPDEYLTPPAENMGVYHRCSPDDSSECVDAEDPPSSFLW